MKNEKIIAVAGAGYWGKNLVRNFHSLGCLHTVCEADNTALERVVSSYPEVNATRVFSEVLENKDIRGVVLSTPASTHYRMAREALSAGKDVCAEKPLCLSEDEGQELIALAEEKGRILMVGHLLWYHPAVLTLKELIEKGQLGRIQYIYSNRLNLGKLRREENVLWSFAPHDISCILGLIGEYPESIWSQGGNYLHRKISDTTITVMSFASGVKAHIFVSWLHPFKEQKLVVVGEKKMAVFDDTLDWSHKLQLFPHRIEWTGNVPVANKAEVQYVKVDEYEPLKAECEHFVHCVETRNIPRTDGREGLKVLRVLNACQESIEREDRISFKAEKTGGKQYFVHETSVVDEGVEIGRGTKVWHFSHLLKGTKIGEGCNIGQNVMIGPNVEVGRGCKIQNNVSIYEGVTLEGEVFCGPSMVFTNVYNPRASIPRMDDLKKTEVKRGVTFGANCTIVCGVTIGEYAFVAAGAVVNSDALPYSLMAGVPAKKIGWMSRYGEKLDLPVEGDGRTSCRHTGEKYILEDGVLRADE